DLVAEDRLAEEHGPAAVVDLTLPGPTDTDLGSTPCVVVGVGAENVGKQAVPAIDVLAADDSELHELLERSEARPAAAPWLAVLLGLTPQIDPELGLAAESAVYSTLQSGPEFHRWRAAHPPRPADDRDTGRFPLVAARDGANLHITLDRPW